MSVGRRSAGLGRPGPGGTSATEPGVPRWVVIDTITTRAWTVRRSMLTKDTRTDASMTIPLSSTRSSTSMTLEYPAANRHRIVEGPHGPAIVAIAMPRHHPKVLSGEKNFSGRRHAAGDHADLARRGQPDRRAREHAAADRDPPGRHVAARRVVDHAGEPRPGGAAADRGEHEHAEDRPVVLALEDLGRDGGDDGCEPIAERALCEDHQVEQRRRGRLLEQQQRDIAEHEPEAAHRPHPLAPDAVGDVAERDLARDTGEADEAERPGGVARAEADLHEVLRLVDLHGVPGVEGAEIAGE